MKMNLSLMTWPIYFCFHRVQFVFVSTVTLLYYYGPDYGFYFLFLCLPSAIGVPDTHMRFIRPVIVFVAQPARLSCHVMTCYYACPDIYQCTRASARYSCTTSHITMTNASYRKWAPLLLKPNVIDRSCAFYPSCLSRDMGWKMIWSHIGPSEIPFKVNYH